MGSEMCIRDRTLDLSLELDFVKGVGQTSCVFNDSLSVELGREQSLNHADDWEFLGLEIALGVNSVNVDHVFKESLDHGNIDGEVRIEEELGEEDSVIILALLDPYLTEEFLRLASKLLTNIQVILVGNVRKLFYLKVVFKR